MKHKKGKELQARIAVCEEMDGTVGEENGVPVCVYPAYEQDAQTKNVNRRYVTVPLEAVGDDLPQYQFRDMFGQTGADVKEKLLKMFNEQGK